MGSVKDLKILKEATLENPGQASFVFSNRYSVFDWGEMPDHIHYKGAAITLLGAHFFEKLEEMDILSHYVGLVEDDTVKKLSEIKKPASTMEIKLLRVISPEFKDDQYDYSIYQKEKGNFLIHDSFYKGSQYCHTKRRRYAIPVWPLSFGMQKVWDKISSSRLKVLSWLW